jgi:SAM-dependent methyltransferase
VDAVAPALAERTYRVADAIAMRPWGDEVTDLPPPVEIDGRAIDVVDDLVAYTQLPADSVSELLMRRRPISFRSEWHATPGPVRLDHWFYLSSKGYLFGNAVHFPDDEIVDRFLAPTLKGGAAVLDFGGGVGTLALRVAAAGYEVAVTELNALQRDFIRFRVHRHGLEQQVRVIDPWEEIPRDRFDALVAIDVLEHVPDGRSLVGGQLLPALRAKSLFVENSRFEVNASNPMHHLDWGLDPQLDQAGYAQIATAEDGTRVWSRG